MYHVVSISKARPRRAQEWDCSPAGRIAFFKDAMDCVWAGWPVQAMIRPLRWSIDIITCAIPLAVSFDAECNQGKG